MTIKSVKGNPFNPGIGKTPPLIAGREEEMSALQAAIDKLVPGAKFGPNEIVMFGPLGVGKTVLLNWIGDECRKKTGENGESAIDVIEISPETGLDDLASIPNLLLSPKAVEKMLERMGFRYRRPDEIEVGGSIAGGVKWTAPKKPLYDLVIKKLIEECREKPKALLVDDAHELKLETKNALIAISSRTSPRAPFFLVLAGAPGLNSRLIDSGGTYIERATTRPIGNLDPESAKLAISEPCEKTGLTVTDDALEYVIGDAQLYPFFLQVWGKNLWDHAKGRGSEEITMDDAEEVAGDVERVRGGMYRDRYKKFLEEDNLLPAIEAVVSACRKGAQINDRKLIQIVEDSLPKTLESRKQKALDIARKIESSDLVWCRGETFEPGIPSFMGYIHERTLENEPENTPDAFSKLRGFGQDDDNELDR